MQLKPPWAPGLLSGTAAAWRGAVTWQRSLIGDNVLNRRR